MFVSGFVCWHIDLDVVLVVGRCLFIVVIIVITWLMVAYFVLIVVIVVFIVGHGLVFNFVVGCLLLVHCSHCCYYCSP